MMSPCVGTLLGAESQWPTLSTLTMINPMLKTPTVKTAPNRLIVYSEHRTAVTRYSYHHHSPERQSYRISSFQAGLGGRHIETQDTRAATGGWFPGRWGQTSRRYAIP